MFYCGEDDGYFINIPQRDPVYKAHLSARAYSYRIMESRGQDNYILMYHSFLNQYAEIQKDVISSDTIRVNLTEAENIKLRSP